MAFKKHWKTVPLPIVPLGDNNGAITYKDVGAWLQMYTTLFIAADSVMVLPELHNAYCGIACYGAIVAAQYPSKLVALAVHNYDPTLFCLAGRMVCVTGLTDCDRGRDMEDWSMDVLEEVFGRKYNDLHSSLHRTGAHIYTHGRGHITGHVEHFGSVYVDISG